MTFEVLAIVIREDRYAIWIDEGDREVRIEKREIVEREARAGGKTLVIISEELAWKLDLYG